MRLYTGAGDEGETGLWRGGRVPKDDPRIAAVGALDEANAHIGLALALIPEGIASETKAEIARCQSELFEIGAEAADGRGEPRLGEGAVRRLEKAIDRLTAELPALDRFILPGGHPAAAALHVARAVARRAEREMVRAARTAPINSFSLVYLNRLSDFLFQAARSINQALGGSESPWEPEDTKRRS